MIYPKTNLPQNPPKLIFPQEQNGKVWGSKFLVKPTSTTQDALERAKIQGDGNATHRCSHGGHGRWPENFRVRAGLDQEIREEPTRLDWL